MLAKYFRKTENTEQYNKCSDKVIDDFSESNLVATDSDENVFWSNKGIK